MPDYQHLLSRYITASQASNDEWRAFCPLHEDPDTSSSDSASFNFAKGEWHCMGCDSGGSIKTLIAQLRRRRKGGSIGPQGKKAPVGNKAKPLPSEDDVLDWHHKLLNGPRLLAYVTEHRGLKIKTIKELQIGHDGFRYTIPIRDGHGDIVNIRRYDPKKSGKNKMVSWGDGWGGARIYRPQDLDGAAKVVLCEGEWDKALGQQMCEPLGVDDDELPWVTSTGGALTFPAAWAPHFAGKDVYICYDDDDKGRRGSLKAGNILKHTAQAVYIINLGTGIDGGDVTDYFVTQNHTCEDFQQLMHKAQETPLGLKTERPPPPTEGTKVTLEQSQSADFWGKVIEMPISAVGRAESTFLVPKTIHATCSQDKGTVCGICPMAAMDGEATRELANDEVNVLIKFLQANDRTTANVMREAVGAMCSDRLRIDVPKTVNLESMHVTHSIEHRTEEQQTPLQLPLVSVGTHKTPVGVPIRVVGKQLASPLDNRGVFMAHHIEEMKTSIDSFKMTPAKYEVMKVLRPRRGQSPLDRCRDIAADLAYNVTRIYGRPQLHIAYDITWHSVLDFYFQGERMEKGWLEMLVVGDTRTGKSKAASKLSDHYNAGIMKSCEGVSFAGLVGGAQQFGNKQWMVAWSVLPLNDRRLVVLDEVSALVGKGIIESMSSIRSSGTAEITKIARGETSARTRLIWISNPVDGRALREVSGGGMEVIGQLMNNPEDIARFDYAMCAASSDVDAHEMNGAKQTVVPHRFTEEVCSLAVMWAWSRKPSQVRWLEGAETAVVDAAIEMGDRYMPDPPLVQSENMRMKLARIAVAIAARTFSSDSTGELLLVNTKHVASAVEFLDMLYGMETFGYLRHSNRLTRIRRDAEEFMDEAREYLEENADDVRHTLLSLGGQNFRMRDFEDLGAMDRIEAKLAVKRLLDMRMISRRKGGSLEMGPVLVRLLHEVEAEDDK